MDQLQAGMGGTARVGRAKQRSGRAVQGAHLCVCRERGDV